MKDNYIWITTLKKLLEDIFLSKSLFLAIRKDIESLLELLLPVIAISSHDFKFLLKII
jgi:hypothetical protein